MNGQEIALLSDAAHALKAIRNALLNNKVIYIHAKHVEHYGLETNDVFWEAIVKLVEFDEERELKIAPHLTRKCIDITKFTKMSVKLAMHVFSWETANALKLVCQNYSDEFPSYYLTTAFFIELVAEWWNVVHSRSRNICFSSGNDEAWEKSTKSIEMFKDVYGNMILNEHQVSGYWPSQRAVLLTSTSILGLANKLVKEDGYQFFLPGRCLNDCIENFFSLVRFINKSPTALMFKRFAKSIAVSQFLKYSPHGSYEEDDSLEYLINLDDFKETQKCVEEEHQDDIMEIFDQDEFDPQDFAEDNSLAYFGGSIMRKIVKGECEECQNEFFAPEDDEQEVNSLIKLKEKKLGVLVKPSWRANKMFKIAEITFRAYRNDLLSVNKKLDKILVKKVIEAIKEELPILLPTCHMNKIVSAFITARLHFWGRFSNNYLRKTQKKDIDEAANGSASMKQVKVTKDY